MERAPARDDAGGLAVGFVLAARAAGLDRTARAAVAGRLPDDLAAAVRTLEATLDALPAGERRRALVDLARPALGPPPAAWPPRARAALASPGSAPSLPGARRLDPELLRRLREAAAREG